MSPLHKAALAYAREGFKIFPCLPNSKSPACKHGFHDATCDEAVITDWWTEWPEANVASPLAECGWSVVDIDAPEAEALWQELSKNDPPTWTVRTPRGGLHVFYATTELPVSVGRLIPGAKIDTRGPGSYVLLSPSHTPKGYYRVELEADVQPLPAWVTPLLANMHKGEPVRTAAIDEDLPVNVGRASKWLRDREPAKEGDMGNQWTYDTAAGMHDFGLSPEKIFDLMAGEWNDRCEPPWSNDELEEIITHATRYRQNEGAQHAARDLNTVYARALEGLPEDLDEALSDGGTTEKKRDNIWRDFAQQAETREPSWLIPGLIPEGETIMLYGPTQSYKSFVALDIALSVASGAPTFAGSPERCGPVFYAALEGRTGVMKKRAPAWLKARGLAPDFPFYVGPGPVFNDADSCMAWVKDTKERLAGRRAGMIFFDTTAKLMAGMDENSAKDMGEIIRWFDHLAIEFDCPIVAVHHTGRLKGGEAVHSRGSSAADGGFGSIITCSANRDSKMVKVQVQKHKDAEEPPEPWYLEGKPFAGSLVFDPVSKEAYLGATRTESAYSVGKVQRILAEHGARGHISNAWSTHTLAVHMATEGGSVEAAERALTKAASKPEFAAYACPMGNRVWVWRIPE